MIATDLRQVADVLDPAGVLTGAHEVTRHPDRVYINPVKCPDCGGKFPSACMVCNGWGVVSS